MIEYNFRDGEGTKVIIDVIAGESIIYKESEELRALNKYFAYLEDNLKLLRRKMITRRTFWENKRKILLAHKGLNTDDGSIKKVFPDAINYFEQSMFEYDMKGCPYDDLKHLT